jgi:hypothetical protein
MTLHPKPSKTPSAAYKHGLHREIDIILSGPRLIPNWWRIRMFAVLGCVLLTVTYYAMYTGQDWLERFSLIGFIISAALIVVHHQWDRLKILTIAEPIMRRSDSIFNFQNWWNHR